MLGAALAVLLVAMARTVPGKDAHYQAVKVGVMEVVDREIAANPELQPYADMGRSAVMSVMDGVLDHKMEVRLSTFYSVGIVTYKGERVPISVGVLGRVFLTVGTDDLEKFAKSHELYQKFNVDEVKKLIREISCFLPLASCF